MIIIFIAVFFILFFFGVLSFIFSYKHLLNMLLRLEFIVLCLFIFIFFYLSIFSFEQYFRIFFLVFRVCEGVLGLSILVSIIRSHGNDYFFSFSFLQC